MKEVNEMVYVYEVLKLHDKSCEIKEGNWIFEEHKLSDDEGNNEFDIKTFDREKHEMNPIWTVKRMGVIKEMSAEDLIAELKFLGKEKGREWLKKNGIQLPEN